MQSSHPAAHPPLTLAIPVFAVTDIVGMAPFAARGIGQEPDR